MRLGASEAGLNLKAEGFAIGPSLDVFFRVPMANDELLLIGPRVGWRAFLVDSVCVTNCTSNTRDQGIWDVGLTFAWSSGI